MFQKAREKMQQAGIEQWTLTYPNYEILAADIKTGSMFVIQNEAKQIAGFVVLDNKSSAEYHQQPWQENKSVLFIHRVVVSPDFQGQGVATQLIQHCEAIARTQKIKAIHSSTHFRNIPMQYVFLKNDYSQVSAFIMQDRPNIGEFFAYEKLIDY
ncbi:GNAT family N-acetyltransferase [Culicoidibacter larvae]|uniref:GNAT family N-acetyltransferase n=1 Tax=Culicoidibacter larvae TaxID=2579976 RepID=UPI001484CDBC|nr:GNAT family N-acetyltransferase [Culicoidibacter larvae]